MLVKVLKKYGKQFSKMCGSPVLEHHSPCILSSRFQKETVASVLPFSVPNDIGHLFTWQFTHACYATGEQWFSIELLCSAMLSYFTDAPMKFSCVDPPHQRFAIERDLITEAVK